MSNVVTLPGTSPPAVEVNPELVTELERLLEAAKSGDLVAFAWADVRVDKTNGTGFINSHDTSDRLGVAVMTLHWRYGRATVEGFE